MAFSEDIKTRAMVACGRCCCICHKFCGNNMEVHHIRARADGGTDTYDNAIPLCFDCHAEVRQYDPKHPKGIRFTEKELIQHRDNWYKTIASNGEKEATTDAEYKSIKILREKGHEDILLQRISTGQELVAIVDGCSAMEYSYDEPKTAEEAEEISKFIQIVNDQLDCLDEYEPGYRVVIAFSLNESIFLSLSYRMALSISIRHIYGVCVFTNFGFIMFNIGSSLMALKTSISFNFGNRILM